MRQINLFQKDVHEISKILGFQLNPDNNRKVNEGHDDRDIRSLYFEILLKSRDISALPIFPEHQRLECTRKQVAMGSKTVPQVHDSLSYDETIFKIEDGLRTTELAQPDPRTVHREGDFGSITPWG